MRTILLALLSFIALAAPSQAAQNTTARDHDTRAEYCRTIIGKEQPDGEGRGGAGRMQAQRFSDCMMGMSQ
jgi:hypothetical protein